MSESERFDRALEKLLADQSPREEAANLTEDQQRMVQMAQMLRGSKNHGAPPEFVVRLRRDLSARPSRISRRSAVLSSLGALAAGIIAGLGLDRWTQNAPSKTAVPLVGTNGRWVQVASLATLPEGAIQQFTAGAVQGFLIHRSGQVHALSRICTHMGCTLDFHQAEQAFVCPCHGAEFDVQGRMRYGPQKYGQKLPPLPKINVRVTGQAVEVWSV